MKIARSKIEQKYASFINSMYEEQKWKRELP
jgi:hypothetical protein